MNTGQLLDYLKHNPDFASNVTHWQVMPARPAKYDDYPDGFDPALRAVLESRGVKRLYSHQRRALDLAQAGKDFVVITPTASGKTMARYCATTNRARCTFSRPRRSPAIRWPSFTRS